MSEEGTVLLRLTVSILACEYIQSVVATTTTILCSQWNLVSLAFSSRLKTHSSPESSSPQDQIVIAPLRLSSYPVLGWSTMQAAIVGLF